jgi:galactitol-specific phosphotransferase system IIB component
MNELKIFLVSLVCTVMCMCGCATSSTRVQMRIEDLDRQLEQQELRVKEAQEEVLRFEGVGDHASVAAMSHHVEQLPPDKKARYRELLDAVRVAEAGYDALSRERQRLRGTLTRPKEQE